MTIPSELEIKKTKLFASCFSFLDIYMNIELVTSVPKSMINKTILISKYTFNLVAI